MPSEACLRFLLILLVTRVSVIRARVYVCDKVCISKANMVVCSVCLLYTILSRLRKDIYVCLEMN